MDTGALAVWVCVFVSAYAAGWLVETVGSRRTVFSRTDPQKTPFLGGSPPQTHAWSRFHVRYYPLTLLLVAFEMEMMFMYPWAVVFVEEGGKALAEMGMFLGLLAVGLVYGWREGAFRWQ